jgi:hypothetical protein
MRVYYNEHGAAPDVRHTAKQMGFDLGVCLGQEDAISLKDAVRSDLTNDEIKTMIVNAELIESTLKQTIMCGCFNDFAWLSKYKKILHASNIY